MISNLKMGSKQSYLWVQTAAWNAKQVCILGKEMSSGLTSRSPERVSDKEEGKSHHTWGPTTENVQEKTVESLVRGI